MELQGKKATHDFLSLYTKDSSFQHQDLSPPSQEGFFLKTHDFLRPLERPEMSGGGGGGGGGWPGGETTTTTTTMVTAAAATTTTDISIGVPITRPVPTVEHVLPGGIGTYSISHVSDKGARAAVVKPERSTCGAVGNGFGQGGNDSKPEPDYDRRSGYVPFAACTRWDEKDSVASSRGQQQWESPFAARAIGTFRSISAANASAAATASCSAARNLSGLERKRFMDGATSRSSRGFDDEEDDDEELGRREGSSTRKDGKGSGTDQRPNTPRSKHSATEQRRRSKINDRFQILRDLIPHSDQKRDKASFLLEVIEYIRFLQEKAQKCESTFPGWNQDNTKLMPWVKVYFRSFWKNARSNRQGPGDCLSDPSQTLKNGSAPPFMYTGKFDDNSMPIAPAVLSNTHNQQETDISVSVPYNAMETPTCFANNIESQDQSPWLRSSGPADCAVNSEILCGQEELTIDDGTISVSTAYSQGILNTLSQALQSSGVDLSQASISVQINLGKRAANRGHAAVSTPNKKEQEGPTSIKQGTGTSRVGSGGEETSQGAKRQRLDAS